MSVFRFVSSRKRGEYSVHRGDVPLGFVTKVSHRIFDRGVTKVVTSGWTPTTTDRRELAMCKTREDAARALWKDRP